MLRVTLIICCLYFLSQSEVAFAQRKANINIKISCGFAGVTSKEFSNIQQFAVSKKYDLIKQKLFSKHKMEAVLSVVALQKLGSNGFTTLSVKEQQRINEIGTWTDAYPICMSCTNHYNGTLKTLLADSTNASYHSISMFF